MSSYNKNRALENQVSTNSCATLDVGMRNFYITLFFVIAKDEKEFIFWIFLFQFWKAILAKATVTRTNLATVNTSSERITLLIVTLAVRTRPVLLEARHTANFVASMLCVSDGNRYTFISKTA